MHDAAKFWAKVNRGDPDACWMWLAGTDKNGYGKQCWNNKHCRAHRIAYELTHGKIPDGALVCHTCDNPGCVNPAHLFIGTNADNMSDMVSKGRSLKGDKHPRAMLSSDLVESIRRMRVAGMLNREIAEKLGIPLRFISPAATGKNWGETVSIPGDHAKRGERTKGERHWRSVLTDQDIVSIRNMHASGMKNSQIAKQFGIRLQHVGKILNRTIWRHVS